MLEIDRIRPSRKTTSDRCAGIETFRYDLNLKKPDPYPSLQKNTGSWFTPQGERGEEKSNTEQEIDFNLPNITESILKTFVLQKK